MTELYLLDRRLERTFGPIDDFVSLVWTERYFENGTFTLVLPLSRALFSAVMEARFLEVRGHSGLGRIEKVRFSGPDGTGHLTVSGRMAESLLGDRILPRGTVVSGALCQSLEALVEANACAGAGERAIPGLHVLSGVPTGAESLIMHEFPGGKQLDAFLYTVLGEHGMSYRVTLNADGTALQFFLVRGLDRTQAQEENSFAVFSTSFSTIGEISFLYDTEDHRNYAVIAGEGEGEARVEVTLDLRTSPDEELRELFVDARDLRSVSGGTAMGAQAYRNLLLARGRERLSARSRIAQVSGTAAAYAVPEETAGTDGRAVHGGSMMAGVDYALGDLCDISSESLGTVWSERVTEITYIYEGRFVRIEPRFGTAYPDLRTYIKRAGTHCVL